MANIFRSAFFLLGAFVMGGISSGYLVKTIYCRSHAGHEIVIPSYIHIDKAFDKENIVDVAIIGSGPAGLAAGLYTSRFARKTVIIQGNNQGGQLMGTSHVENWPGIKKILGPDLIAQLREQTASFGPQFLSDAVERVDLDQWPYVIHTENGVTIHALSIIVATGASPKKLGVIGEQEYWGRGVTTCAICDAPFYKEADVVVVGGGDSAIEEAIQLAPYAKNITLLVRGNKMRATPVMQARLEGYANIKVLYNVAIQKIIGDDVHVTSIEVVNTATGEISRTPINGVFLAIGHEPNTKQFVGKLALNKAGYILMQGRSQTSSVAGVFAAGDVEDDVYRQGGVAAGNGIKAAIDADRFLAFIGLDSKMQAQLAKQYMVVKKEEAVSLPEIETLQQYEETLGDRLVPVILDFYTQSCPSCLQMLPVLASVAQDFKGRVKVVKVDAEIAFELVEKFLVYKVPCLIVIKDGALVARYNDAMGKKELTELIEQIVH